LVHIYFVSFSCTTIKFKGYKMKKLLIIVPMLLTGVFAATNFSNMSNEQLQNMRGKVATSEQSAFRAKMKKRMGTGTMQKGQGAGAGMMSGGMGQGAGNCNAQKGQGKGLNKNKNKLY
jgi:hypothetical protein